MDLITIDCLGKADKAVTNDKNTVITTIDLGEDLTERIKSVKKAIKKEDARPFKVADNILMRVIDPLTGEKALPDSKFTIIEAYKNNKIDSALDKDINNRLKNDNILRFY